MYPIYCPMTFVRACLRGNEANHNRLWRATRRADACRGVPDLLLLLLLLLRVR
jgi:hypothetical protein